MQQRTLSLIGPGRAGTAVADALVARGWRVSAVAGRDADRAERAAQRYGSVVAPPGTVARDSALIIVATPDAAVADVARTVVDGAEPDALVLHLAGAHGVALLAVAQAARPDLRYGALHPLQTLSGASGADRLPGSFAAVEGPDAVADIAREMGLRPFTVSPDRRTRYHAAAAIASNHLVALLGTVERAARDAGVPFEAFLPLARASVEAVATVGAADALTGPVARGDRATVLAHLDALAPEERGAYRALALEELRLTGRDDPGLEAVLA